MEIVKLRDVVGTLMLTVFLGCALAPAASAQYPPTAGNGRVTRSTVGPGGCVTFSGDGFAPNTEVTVTDNQTTVGTVTTSLTGTFSFEVCPTVLGVHILRGTGQTPTGATRVVVAQVRVLGSLASTGTATNDTRQTVAVGAALIVAGAGAVVMARRRRTRAVAA